MIKFESQKIEGLKLLPPFYAEDRRGSFMKTFEKEQFRQHGIFLDLFETFYTRSARGTVRGLHFQRNFCQDKLVHVLHGKVFDVAVDLRKDSPTFGQWQGFYLSAENRQMLYIPKGFAHGFLAMEEDTLFSYLCGDRYDPQSDGGIIWNDPDLSIDWPLDQVDEVILSDKDRNLQTFAEFSSEFGALKV